MADHNGRNKARKPSLGVLILAAGQGTRMESSIPKVLHPICGQPMLFYALRLANALKPQGIGVVIGHEAERVKAAVQRMSKETGLARPISFIHQKSALGSGNAVFESIPFLKKFGMALVLCGDTPLLTYESAHGLVQNQAGQKGPVTLLTAKLAQPKGYGRVIRSPLGEVLRIVEESVGSPKELAVNEINSGAYCFQVDSLLSGIREIGASGPKKEHFLTDILEILRAKGGKISAYVSQNPEEVLGVNSRVQLSTVERIANRRALERLMLSGVTVIDPASTYVDSGVEVGRDSILYPGAILRGRTRIGRLCRIGPFCHVEDSQIGDDCEVRMSQVIGARLLEKCHIGPFSNIRPESTLGPGAKIGNFSEIKASRIGLGAKVSHLSYIGDAEVAEDVNIGAGTITCNYDGKRKHKTAIGANAFIGSNVNLIAPIKVGRGAKIAAGSTITEDVPAEALAIARARQVNKT